MKFGRPLAIIVHHTVHFNLECCKRSVSDMDPNTILNMLNILSKYVLKDIKKIQHTILMKFGGPLAMYSALHSTIQFGVLQKLCVGHGP